MLFAFEYLRHLVTAKHTGGHGVHSPFVFHLIRHIFTDRNPYYCFAEIEALRQQLKNDRRNVAVTDFGTGKNRVRTISGIANGTLKPIRQAQLLFRIMQHYGCKNSLELGTSLGITTMYMAAGSKHCTTIEGCQNTAAIAQDNFRKTGCTNITLHVADISKQLTDILEQHSPFDFIFIDANHRYEALIQYFETCMNFIEDNSIIVIDDIYWSPGMKKAWKQLMQHPRVNTSIDMFHMGILMTHPKLKKQHYKVIFH